MPVAGVSDHYSVLGVEREATPTELKKAYFRLIRQHTPEDDPEAFRLVSEAYRVLSNPETRTDYDNSESVPDEILSQLQASFSLIDDDPYEAEVAADALLEDHPEYELIRSAVGALYLRVDQNSKALDVFQELSREFPDSAIYAKLLGVSLCELDRKQEGIKRIKESITLDPSDSDAYLTLAGVYAEDDRDAEALKVLDRGIRADGSVDIQDLPLFVRKIFIHAKTRDWSEMETASRALIETVPMDDPDARSYVASHFGQMAYIFQEAEVPHLMKFALDELLKLTPDDQEAQRISRELSGVASTHREAEQMMDDPGVEDWIKATIAPFFADATEAQNEERYKEIVMFVATEGVQECRIQWNRCLLRYPALKRMAGEFWEQVESHAGAIRSSYRDPSRRQYSSTSSQGDGCVVLFVTLGGLLLGSLLLLLGVSV